MIDEIIKEIKDMEAKADDMQKEAYQKAKEIVLKAELDAEELKKKTIKECKASQKQAVAKAETDAQEKRDVILKKGKNEALILQEEKSKLANKKVDDIVKALLDKYCK